MDIDTRYASLIEMLSAEMEITPEICAHIERMRRITWQQYFICKKMRENNKQSTSPIASVEIAPLK
jgi:hypothetical protein